MKEALIPVVRNAFMRPRIVAFIPAHNEEKSIRDCLEGLADQDLPPSIELDIIVIADNCHDRTAEVAMCSGQELHLNVMVIKTENNKQRKVGALNAAWKSLYGDLLDIYDQELSPYQEIYNKSVKAILGMDADSRLAPGALKHLWDGMSARNIGGVMAKYTMRMPRKMSELSPDDPHYEVKLESGNYGSQITRWWTHQQKQDMTSWLLALQYKGGSTYVLGGQGTLFRPAALHDIVQRNNLDGPWQDDSDVEDMLLTWQLQKAKWKTLISPTARCYVDAMRSYHTFRQQRIKWASGTLDLMTNQELGLRTPHRLKLWRSECRKLLDLTIRIMLITLLTIALVTDQFSWNWLWIIPIAVAVILNLVLALKTPMRRPIDVVMSSTLISSEIYLWANLITFLQVWLDKLSQNRKDGWQNQYSAEQGKTKSRLVEGVILITLLIAAAVGFAIYNRSFFTSTSVKMTVSPFLEIGWILLTYLTILATCIMIHQLWTLRRNYKA
ncbi:LOW QUALITY PROTEIN: glycosyltransferase, family 2 [Bacillus sp. JCM 19045]|nr:LOW QUALITY PROTEIN: glycosyltransferase, family 2 [Bacillus sp. JCM 19045]